MNNFWNAGMPTSPLLSKAGPLFFDHTTIFKTNCKTNRSVALTSDSYDIAPGTISDLIFVQRLTETDTISHCQRQQIRSAIATDGDQAEVFALNEPFLTQNLASSEIERGSVSVPARYDNNVVTMRLSKRD